MRWRYETLPNLPHTNESERCLRTLQARDRPERPSDQIYGRKSEDATGEIDHERQGKTREGELAELLIQEKKWEIAVSFFVSGGMMALKWLRLYTEILDDPKVAKLSDKDFRHFISMLCVAQECDQNGKITMSINDISWRIRASEKDLKRSINNLLDVGIISLSDDCITFLAWEKRQFPSDHVGERVKRYREKSVTLQETLQNEKCNGADTDSDKTQTQTQTLKEINKEKISEIVSYLNQKTGSSYRESSDKTKTLISARLAEGFTPEDFLTVIDKKCSSWINDPKMCKFLRPETLFSNKFESYLNEKVTLSEQGKMSEKTEKGLDAIQRFIIGGDDNA